MAKWQAMNYSHTIPDVNQPFYIDCPNETDIYDKPPSTHRFDAPFIYTTTTQSAFRRAAITVVGDAFTYLYDQGGLCIVMNLPDGSRKWVKAGMEMVGGQVFISVVTKDNWADWSLRPLLKLDSPVSHIQFEIEDDGALWVYVIDEQGTKIPVREVTWWSALDSNTEILIGPAAARPSKEPGDLIVKFEDFTLDTA